MYGTMKSDSTYRRPFITLVILILGTLSGCQGGGNLSRGVPGTDVEKTNNSGQWKSDQNDEYARRKCRGAPAHTDHRQRHQRRQHATTGTAQIHGRQRAGAFLFEPVHQGDGEREENEVDEDRAASITELAEQREDARLEQRLAPRELDERGSEREGIAKNVAARHPRSFVERLRGIAPRAAKVAPGQAHEGARHADERRFALHASIDLVDDERVLFHAPRVLMHLGRGATNPLGAGSPSSPLLARRRPPC